MVLEVKEADSIIFPLNKNICVCMITFLEKKKKKKTMGSTLT